MCPRWWLLLYLFFWIQFELVRAWADPPNLVLILTDDQDAEMFSLSPMQKTRKRLEERGVRFDAAFVTTPVCCPSRASILTGLYAHNHGTKNNSRHGGCSSVFWTKHLEPKTIPVRLQHLGYVTMYAGKYLNAYGKHGKERGRPPLGWDWWNGLIGNSVYFNYDLSVNGTLEFHGNSSDDYLTTVIFQKTMHFLEFSRRQLEDARPLFVILCPPAPHAPFTPTKNYKNLFNSTVALWTPNYNFPGKNKHWLVRTAKSPMDPTVVDLVDETFRNRWRTLMSVDDLVDGVIQKLADIGRLDNTYIVFTSDNGFHTGQFCLPWDKRQPYEFDIRVPLLVRGPGIPPNTSVSVPVLNIDLAPTLLELAVGRSILPRTMDGRSLVQWLFEPRTDRHRKKTWRKHFLVEYWGEADVGIPEACAQLRHRGVAECHPDCVCEDARNNTYSCIRTSNGARQQLFCQFKDEENFKEIYNLHQDPYQLRNLVVQTTPSRIQKLRRVLSKLKRCRRSSCP